MSLTLEEKAIAKKIGFDEKALALIKERLKPQMSIVRSGGLEQQDMDFVQGNQMSVAPLLEKDKQTYIEVAKEFPELAPVVKFELDFYTRSHDLQLVLEQQSIKQLGEDEYKRRKRFQEEMKDYLPLMAQEAQDSYRGPDKKNMRVRAFVEPFGSDAALEKAISEAKKSPRR